jgi:dethiobiotin synthetase
VQGHRSLARRVDLVLVETAGGLLSPLAEHTTNRDLIRALRLPTLVVAANRLGALNHALLTVEALRGARVRVAGVVLNHPKPPRGPAERSNLRELRRLLPGLRVAECPFRGGARAADALARLALR